MSGYFAVILLSAELVHLERAYVRPVHQSMILFAVGPMLRTKASVSSTEKLAKTVSYPEKPFLPITGSVGKNPAQKVTALPHIQDVEWVQTRTG